MELKPARARLPWKPSEYITCHDRRPPVPCLIALSRKPYRLIEIREVSPGNWDNDDWQEYERTVSWMRDAGRPFPAPDEWDRRPVMFIVTEPQSTQRLMAKVRLWQTNFNGWYILSEHHAVCASCGELTPCREYEAERARDRAAQLANEKLERDLKVLPGCCWGCGEVISQRQKSIVFEGDNADLPGGPPAAFHTRQKCRYEAMAYEERWVKLEPGRRAKLSCPGKVIYHVDGMECSEEPLCPGEGARHRGGMLDHRYYNDSICLRCKDARARG